MAELYEEALPVVVVPEGTVNGKRSLFDSPLPVVIIGDDNGTPQPTQLPARLGQTTQVLGAGTDLDQDLDELGSGWYYCSGFVNTALGDDRAAILEIVTAESVQLQRVTDITTGAVHQRLSTGDWSELTNGLSE